ncbi:MAG: hypothetical protein OEZ03_05400 [Alphaproteobacteria bacterium]|nr:hypothetical protein [Alphaproteobacteria bacterium]
MTNSEQPDQKQNCFQPPDIVAKCQYQKLNMSYPIREQGLSGSQHHPGGSQPFVHQGPAEYTSIGDFRRYFFTAHIGRMDASTPLVNPTERFSLQQFMR